MPRPQDYIITRPQLTAALAYMLEDGTLGEYTDPIKLAAEIMYRRDLMDAQLVRESQLTDEKGQDDAGDQAAEDHQDAGSAGS